MFFSTNICLIYPYLHYCKYNFIRKRNCLWLTLYWLYTKVHFLYNFKKYTWGKLYDPALLKNSFVIRYLQWLQCVCLIALRLFPLPDFIVKIAFLKKFFNPLPSYSWDLTLGIIKTIFNAYLSTVQSTWLTFSQRAIGSTVL